MIELEKNYDPQKIEEKWSEVWLGEKHNHAEPAQGGEPYCVMIPPPNVTGILHMGHALNSTVQDIMVRWRRMQGRNALWLPGTDHAGIATQNVVERALKKEGKTRDDVGREAFIEKVWAWRKEYGGTIINQLKKLGSSCDWDRERFTMDEGLSDAVAEVFVRLYNKGLIYRGKYIINWCPRCQTALSDEESEHQDEDGKLYYIKYPVKDGGPKAFVTVATTRPETMLGDTAVAVNPGDGRFTELVGKSLVLPILERELPVVADDFVDPEFGTGAVKVTPAHDPNDFEIGRRHELEPINIMNDDGILNEAAGPYAGIDRFEARKKLIEDLSAQGYIEKIEDHKHAVGHCYRCDTVVEPRLSPQWFVKMKPLAARAIEVVKQGKVVFVPERWTKVYLEWLENIRDWCISRQIWWGHRIPVFYCDACKHEWAAKGQPDSCPECSSPSITQDEDVLDTWFSSWLWPFTTLGWPEKTKDLDYYYPTHDLVTASEIIFFWVARMIMAGLEFIDDVPFRRVYIHGTVRDDKGRKMSKSLGNSIDPVTIINEYSADALRFSLIMITSTGQDVYLSNDKFEIGRNFGTKLWNAARYMQMHSEGFTPNIETPPFGETTLSPDDQYILHNLHQTIEICNANLERFRFNDYAHAVYEFVWHQYCDRYVENSKAILYGDDPARREHALVVMHHIFSSALRLLHPIMPFVTEELWHAMGYGEESETIARAAWPVVMEEEELSAWGIDPKTVGNVADKYDLVRVGRTLRADYGLQPSRKLDYIVKPNTQADAEFLEFDKESVMTLLRAESVIIDTEFEPEKMTPSGVSKFGVVYMPVEGIIDVDAEIARLSRELEKLTSDLSRITAKLENMDFVQRAPKNVVDRQRTNKQELLERSEKLSRLIETLSS